MFVLQTTMFGYCSYLTSCPTRAAVDHSHANTDSQSSFDLHSLLAKNSKHLFKYFSAIEVFYFDISLSTSVPMEWFYFGYLGFLSSLYILCISPILDVELVKSHFPLCRVFIQMAVSFALHSLFSFMSSHLGLVDLSAVLSVFCSGSLLCGQVQGYLPFLFHQIRCVCFILKFLVHLKSSYVWDDIYESILILHTVIIWPPTFIF